MLETLCDRCGGKFHWSELIEHRRGCNQPERQESSYAMPRVDTDCAHPNCTNWADEGDLCEPHAWQCDHPDEPYDPFVFTVDPEHPHRASFHKFVKDAPEEHKHARSSSGMGSGQHKPSRDEPRSKDASWPSGYPDETTEDDEEPAEEETDDEDVELVGYDEQDEGDWA